MKPVPQFVLTAVVSGLSALGAVALLAPTQSAEPAAGTEAAISGLQSALAEVQSGQRELRASLDHVALRLSAPAPREEGRPLEDLDAAVARVLDQREALRTQAAAVPAVAELDVDDAVAALLDPQLDGDAREALWQKVREAGLLDDVLAVYEARAKARPGDPTAQVELGEACLQKIFEVGSGPLAGVWASKADAAFDAALAIDAQHWDARFSKAVSLSFWPPIFGKQPEAIAHFETLLAQQSKQAKNPQFAQTYVMLGNLYAQQGKSDQALATWKQGLAEFPGHAELTGKLGAP